MDLDKNRITIHERAYVDTLDLALRVLREFAWPLIPVFCAGVAPMVVFNGWLLSGFAHGEFDSEIPGSHVALMLLLIALEAPLATAPATLYLGRALFTERPRLRGVVRDLWESLPQLLIFQVFLRPFSLWWTYVNEVILLDRNPLRRRTPEGRTTLSRVRTVHRGEGSDLFTRAILSDCLGTLLVASWWLAAVLVRSMLLGYLEWDRILLTFYLPLTLWIAVCYFSVVRFLGYLDLRIRREGWEVELAMRAERDRLTRRWL